MNAAARCVLLACAIGLVPLEAAEGGIRLASAWARATAPTAMAGSAFLLVINDGIQDDELLGATATVAGSVELHTHIKDAKGVLRMTELERISLPGHDTVRLQPGGTHLMLLDLHGPLRPGSSFSLTCRFAHAGPITTTVQVLAAGAMGPVPDAATP